MSFLDGIIHVAPRVTVCTRLIWRPSARSVEVVFFRHMGMRQAGMESGLASSWPSLLCIGCSGGLLSVCAGHDNFYRLLLSGKL